MQKHIRVKYDLHKCGRWLRFWTERFDNHSITHHSLSEGRLRAINMRCGANWQKNHPTYVGVSSEFDDFQRFVEWSKEQYGYNLDSGSWCLDKDILAPENKVYSEATCLFVPGEVNKFFCMGGAPKNAYPNNEPDLPNVGYSYALDKYTAQCGSLQAKFNNPMEAHTWWQKEKIRQAVMLKMRYNEHTMLRDALEQRIAQVQEDLQYGRITYRF